MIFERSKFHSTRKFIDALHIRSTLPRGSVLLGLLKLYVYSNIFLDFWRSSLRVFPWHLPVCFYRSMYHVHSFEIKFSSIHEQRMAKIIWFFAVELLIYFVFCTMKSSREEIQQLVEKTGEHCKERNAFTAHLKGCPQHADYVTVPWSVFHDHP